METIWEQEEDYVYVVDEEEQDQEQWFQKKFWQLWETMYLLKG